MIVILANACGWTFARPFPLGTEHLLNEICPPFDSDG
jgi:hypothetical protein